MDLFFYPVTPGKFNMQLYFPPNFERYLFHLHDGPLRNENDTRFLVLSLSQGRRHVSVLKEGVSSLKNKSSFTLRPSHPWSRSVVVFGLNRHQHHKCQVWRATFFSHNPEKAWTLKSSQPNVKKKKKLFTVCGHEKCVDVYDDLCDVPGENM